jgi:hypothetical protein
MGRAWPSIGRAWGVHAALSMHADQLVACHILTCMARTPCSMLYPPPPAVCFLWRHRDRVLCPACHEHGSLVGEINAAAGRRLIIRAPVSELPILASPPARDDVTAWGWTGGGGGRFRIRSRGQHAAQSNRNHSHSGAPRCASFHSPTPAHGQTPLWVEGGSRGALGGGSPPALLSSPPALLSSRYQTDKVKPHKNPAVSAKSVRA